MPGLRLQGEISLDGSGWQRGLDSAKVAADRFATQTLSGIKNQIAGAFSVGAISQLTRATIQWAGELRDASDNLGVNVEWLQRVTNGAKEAGASLGDVSKLINEINKSRLEAFNNPSSKAGQAFGRLGVSSSDITGLSTQAFVQKLIDSFRNGVSSQSAIDIQEVGGKTAKDLIAAFSSQFASDAPILTEDIIDQLDSVGDKFTSLATLLKVELAPAIVYVVDKITNALGRIRQSQSFAGGFFGTLIGRGGEAASAIAENKGGGAQGIKAIFSKFGEIFSDALNEGAKDMAAESDIQASMDRAIKSGIDASRKSRRLRENAAPSFEPNVSSQSVKPYTDALLSVGNFLGAGTRSAIDNVAKQQLSVQQQTLTEIKGLREDSKKGSTIKVP